MVAVIIPVKVAITVTSVECLILEQDRLGTDYLKLETLIERPNSERITVKITAFYLLTI